MKAKSNIEKWFKFISLYEQLEMSFKLYELIFPKFFTGMLKIFRMNKGNFVIEQAIICEIIKNICNHITDEVVVYI